MLHVGAEEHITVLLLPHKWAHNVGECFVLPSCQLAALNANPDAHPGWYATDRKHRNGGFVMKRLLTLGAASIAVLLLVVTPVASQAPQAEKTFSGTLTKVDAEKKVITVKGAGNQPEMTFMYDDKTQVTGEEKTVQGLAGKSGAMLRVTYREAGADRIATRIDVSEAKK